MDIISKLTDALAERRRAHPETSYVASLYAGGLDQILKKVGEEATEVVLAAKDANPGAANEELINEVADLWFHCMVMLVHLEADPRAVLRTLEARFGTSGHAEKNARKQD